MSTEPTLISRRHFIQRSLATGLSLSSAGLLLGMRTAPFSELIGEAQAAEGSFDPNVFMHVGPDGWVTIVCHRSEMGQGVRSSFPVLLADELGADMERVRIVQADGDKIYGDQNTDGSSSFRNNYKKMRLMAATARQMLVTAAADRWKVPAESCVAEYHSVVHRESGRKLGFGDLAEAAGRLAVPDVSKVKVKEKLELHYVGNDLPLLDAQAYVTGKAQYGADVKLPGMLVAAIARPPVVGSTVVKFDSSAAEKIPGVKKIIQMPAPKTPYVFQPWGGVAVLADNTWAAIKGRDALQIQWSDSPNAKYSSDEYKKELQKAIGKPGDVVRNVGDVDAALAKAHHVIEADYYAPHLSHATMEPPAAIAHYKGGSCEAWAPTQNPQAARTEVARVLGLPESKVAVHVTFLGGGFGRKSKADFVSEAAYLSREAGAPVRVQFTREDDIQHDYYHSVSMQKLTAGFDKEGRITAWRHRTAFPPIATLFGGNTTPGPGELQQGVMDLALAIPNVRAEGCTGEAHVRIGWLRSVYNIFHSFAVNSFIDELAHARKKDPLEMFLEVYGPARALTLQDLGVEKLSNYGASLEEHPVDAGRLRGVLERVALNSDWKNRGRNHRHLGIAAHRSFLSYTAAVASVKKTPQGGIHVDEVWIVADAATLVNTERVRSQMEGAAIFGMSIALHGEITMKNGVTEQTNFDGYPVVRMSEAPRAIHVDLIRSDDAPGGVGEPGVPPMAPAIVNAVFALTGKRARELPLSRSGIAGF